MPAKKKNGVPDRWTDYTSVGKRIPGTRFIAFKVPLKQSFRYHLTQSEAFGPFDLVRMLEKEGQELGLIVDLTFTTRYYKAEDLPNTLYHLKIFTAGHEVPNDATILSFKKAVRHFLRDNENNDKLIGVHCTHGLNRTGYLICRYLIDVDGMNPQKAIDLFNESRGHSIERQNYLEDLRTGPKRRTRSQVFFCFFFLEYDRQEKRRVSTSISCLSAGKKLRLGGHSTSWAQSRTRSVRVILNLFGMAPQGVVHLQSANFWRAHKIELMSLGMLAPCQWSSCRQASVPIVQSGENKSLDKKLGGLL
uniref:RNA/RNP complex-1-interacting phosphatase n=1 Tax=Cyprinus carpio TaxID=7962 RepID=A0A8C2HKS3_CYPCA